MPTTHPKKSVKKVVRKTVKKRPVFQVTTPDQKPLMSTVVEVDTSSNTTPSMTVISEEVVAEPRVLDTVTVSDLAETENAPLPTETQIDQVEMPESIVTEAPHDEQLEPILERVDKKSKFILFFGIGFVLGIMAASIVLFFYSKKPSNEKISEPTAKIVSSPSPSLVPILNKEDWVWQVQNGSGISGAAKVAADKLEKLGFVVESTGNAVDTDYEGYSIYLKSKESSDSALLIKALIDDFEDASVSGTFTPVNDSTSTARLIIGR